VIVRRCSELARSVSLNLERLALPSLLIALLLPYCRVALLWPQKKRTLAFMSGTSSRSPILVRAFAICLSVVGLNSVGVSLAPGAMSAQPRQLGIAAVSGQRQLTDLSVSLAVTFAELQAGTDFSAEDAATLKADLIVWFENNPDGDLFNEVAKVRYRHLSTQFDFGIMRYKYWEQLGKSPEIFESFKTEPWYGVILKYNPIVVRAEGMVITQRDIDWQFNADSYIAGIAGVTPPSEADKERFAGALPSRFASMSAEEREQLKGSQLRLAQVKLCMQGRTKTVIESYIRANVQDSGDVARVARQVEDDSLYKYPCERGVHFAPVVVATSGEHQLTDQQLNLAVVYAQVQAGTGFSAEDAATLKADTIAWFKKNPEGDLFIGVTNSFKNRNLSSDFDVGAIRYIYWDQFGKHPESLDVFKTEPWYGVILKYNPILVQAEGMVITQRDVDWLFYANGFVAEIAGVAPPSDADKERFASTLPSRFASMSAEEREQLRGSQLRLAKVLMCMQGTAIKTRAAIESYIRANVHTSEDVARVARQVENDSQPRQLYDRASIAEMSNALSASQQALGTITRQGAALGNFWRTWQAFQRP